MTVRLALTSDGWCELTGGFTLVTWPGLAVFAVVIPWWWPW